MTQETNKELTRRFFEGFSAGDISVINELVSPDLIDHTTEVPDGVSAFEMLTGNVSMLKGAVPDVKFVVTDIVAEGSKIAVFTTMTGTHEGELMGLPATGNAISVNSVDFFRFEDGQIVERWGVEDSLVMMTQLGAIPPMTESE